MRNTSPLCIAPGTVCVPVRPYVLCPHKFTTYKFVPTGTICASPSFHLLGLRYHLYTTGHFLRILSASPAPITPWALTWWTTMPRETVRMSLMTTLFIPVARLRIDVFTAMFPLVTIPAPGVVSALIDRVAVWTPDLFVVVVPVRLLFHCCWRDLGSLEE